MAKPSRRAVCGRPEARARAREAVAYLEVATLALGERSRDEFLSVAAGDAVLAGIAASDAICCARLGCRYRGEDHRGATELLKTATPDGDRLAASLARLLDMKDEAHYGVMSVSARKARDAVKWAGSLVARATDEVER